MQEDLVLRRGGDFQGEASQRTPAEPALVASADTSDVAAPPIRLSHRQRVALALSLLAAGLFFLVLVRQILTPFICALVAAYVFTPLVDWLAARTRFPRQLLVVVIYLAFVASLAATVATVLPALRSETSDLRDAVPRMFRSLEENILSQEPISFLGFHVDARMISDALNQALRGLPGGALRAVERTFEFLGNLLIFLVATFYLLVDWHRISSRLRSLIPPRYGGEALALGNEINLVLGRYIRGQLLLVGLMTTVTWIALSPILHLRFATVVSVATGILELFPIVGPVTAGAIAVSIGLFQTNPFGWPPALYGLVIAGVYAVLRYAEDYLVIPAVIGHVTKLHPLVVLFALICGAALGGILGMFIAVPLTAVFKIVLTYLYGKLVDEPVG